MSAFGVAGKHHCVWEAPAGREIPPASSWPRTQWPSTQTCCDSRSHRGPHGDTPCVLGVQRIVLRLCRGNAEHWMMDSGMGGSQHDIWVSDQPWGNPTPTMDFLATLWGHLSQVLWGKDKHTPGHVSNSSAGQPGSTHISELDQPQLPELSHTAVGSLHLQEELPQAHLLAPEDRSHLASCPPTWMALGVLVAAARSSLPRQGQEGAKLCRNIGVTESKSCKRGQCCPSCPPKGFLHLLRASLDPHEASSHQRAVIDAKVCGCHRERGEPPLSCDKWWEIPCPVLCWT